MYFSDQHFILTGHFMRVTTVKCFSNTKQLKYWVENHCSVLK